MSNKFFFTVITYGVGTAALSAQATSAFYSAPMEQTALTGIVDDLSQHALFALLGAIVFAGVIYVAYVWKHCNDLSVKRKNTTHSQSIALVLFVAGLSAFGSSCTTAQRAQAADIRAAQAAENRNCPMNQHYDEPANMAFNSRSLYNGYSNWYAPSFCKFCGKRIYKSFH